MAITPLSPVTYTGTGQITPPAGSIIDSGGGPKVTPTPAGTVGPADKGLYSRIGDVPAVNPIPTNVQMNNQQAPLVAAADKARAAQSAVDYVNTVADKKIQDFSSGAGANNVGRQNAISALLGLSGSSAAGDREGVATGQNKKVTDSINLERAQRISSIYGALDTATNQASDEYRKNLNADADTVAADQSTRATSVLTSLAKELGNVTYGQFKSADPQTYKKILDLAGGDDAKLELLYSSAMTPSKTAAASGNPMSNYHFTSDGRVYFADPKTGTISERTDMEHLNPGTGATSQYGSSPYKLPDGTIVLVPNDAKGKPQYDATKPYGGGVPMIDKDGQTIKPPVKPPVTPKPKNPAAPATPLTKPQYAKLESAGVDSTMADKLTAAILKGISLDDIRAALRKDNVDPAILDHYDNVVGIASLLKGQKPKTSSASTGFGGGQ